MKYCAHGPSLLSFAIAKYYFFSSSIFLLYICNFNSLASFLIFLHRLLADIFTPYSVFLFSLKLSCLEI